VAAEKENLELSMLEQRIMLVILRQHPNAYGISIQDKLTKETGKEYSVGSIYAVLERLEEKKFVSLRMGDPTDERGGKRKAFYTLTATGRSALEQSLAIIENLRRGVKWRGATT
jgi:PadR family transcriptional regulator, regulatory protein PadR